LVLRLRLCGLGTLFLHRFMVPNRAARGRTQNPVVPCHMPGHTAYRGACHTTGLSGHRQCNRNRGYRNRVLKVTHSPVLPCNALRNASRAAAAQRLRVHKFACA
jgi:hypothetical protein